MMMMNSKIFVVVFPSFRNVFRRLIILYLPIPIVFTYTYTDNRMTSSQKVLQNNPMNYNALKDVALSINLLALEEEKRIHKNVLSSPTGMVHLTDESFDDLVMRGIRDVLQIVILSRN